MIPRHPVQQANSDRTGLFVPPGRLFVRVRHPFFAQRTSKTHARPKRLQLVLGVVMAALLAGPGWGFAADPSPKPKPVRFQAFSDGRLLVDGQTFNSMTEYFTSAFFKSNGKRCGVRLLDSSVVRPFPDKGSPSDCSMTATTIQGEYYPDEYYLIPIVFHVIHKSDGTGNIADSLILSQVDILNEDFGALAGTPGAPGHDSHVRFELAGITRTENDNWFNDNDENGFKTALGWDQDTYFNVYVNSAGGYLGYSYFPQQVAGDILDGVVVLYSAVGRNSGYPPYDQGRTLSHETGHYLGLYHTFEGYSCSNTYTTADLVVDTNPENTDHYGCTQTSSCSVPDPIHNYLNYTDDICMEEFTAEQSNRMMCALMNYRSGLYHIDRLGDLDDDGSVQSPDLAILINHLADNLAVGAVPFNASILMADINKDAAVDAADLVVLGSFLAGSASQL